MLKIMDSVQTVERFLAKKMKTDSGCVVIDVTSGTTLHVTSCQLKTALLINSTV